MQVRTREIYVQGVGFKSAWVLQTWVEYDDGLALAYDHSSGEVYASKWCGIGNKTRNIHDVVVEDADLEKYALLRNVYETRSSYQKLREVMNRTSV
jgi:hypothetical protein